MMKVTDYDFHLPTKLIAQTPLEKRSESKLFILDRKTAAMTHHSFPHFITELEEGDVLVLNDTKVLPARLTGLKEETGAAIELLLLKELENDVWESLVKNARRIKVGDVVTFGKGILRGTCIKVLPQGGRHFKFSYKGIFYEILEQLGEMPLPPYITEKLDEEDRYQTVFAKERGSAAAPTAGLHFTDQILNEIKKRGVRIVFITLHVGLGTFRPVSVQSIEEHTMHEEYFDLSEEAAQTINEAKKQGKKIVAVGTTSARTLETVATLHDGKVVACNGWTDIFIYPSYQFKVVDCLLTNFHLPKSTLLMLVSAFASKELIMKAYEEAVLHNYRFFSFGDAMFIK